MKQVLKLEENLDAIAKIQTQSRENWEEFSSSVRNYITSSLGSTYDNSAADEWVSLKISKLDNSLSRAYLDKSNVKLTKILSTIMSLISVKIDIVKNTHVVQSSRLIDYQLIRALAEFLDTEEPTQWKSQDAVELLEQIFNIWINQILCRTARQWEMDLGYCDEINRLIRIVADVFSGDIIDSHPETYTKLGEQK